MNVPGAIGPVGFVHRFIYVHTADTTRTHIFEVIGETVRFYSDPAYYRIAGSDNAGTQNGYKIGCDEFHATFHYAWGIEDVDFMRHLRFEKSEYFRDYAGVDVYHGHQLAVWRFEDGVPVRYLADVRNLCVVIHLENRPMTREEFLNWQLVASFGCLQGGGA